MLKLLQQIKKRRKMLGLKQSDMFQRIGISRQQYQHIETKGNPRLNTLALIAKGLNSEILLIPNEKLSKVQSILNSNKEVTSPEDSLSDDPWQDLLGDEL